MPGNSQRRGRRTTVKKGPSVGSGGKNRDRLKGSGQTLPSEDRPWHKGYSGSEPLPRKTAWKQEKERRMAQAEGRVPKVGKPGTRALPGAGARADNSSRAGSASRAGGPSRTGSGSRVGAGGRTGGGARAGAGSRVSGGARVAPGRRMIAHRESAELLVGRNPVLEAMRTHIPATALFVAHGIEIDDRISAIVKLASDHGLPLLEVGRAELDRMTAGVLHQGVALQVPPYAYEPFDDLLASAQEAVAPMLVALDGVTDPRNLGAVVRSAAAFGANGLFLPERRAAGITATAWRTSAGAAARIPIAQVTNLTRSLKACQEQGFAVVGLDADGPTSVYDLEVAVGPVVVVVGSEGRGLSRLVGQTCDLLVNIPIAETVESLNASVAAAVTLAEIARRRAG